jgi:hypothetical protein
MRDKQTRNLVDEYRVLMNEKINAWLSLPSKEYHKVRERVSPRMAKLASEIDAVITGKTMTAVAAGIARNMDNKPVDMEVPF